MTRSTPIIISLSCGLLLGCVTSGGSADTPEPKTPLQEAEGHLNTKDYAKARAALEAHLADAPEDTQARYMLAKTLGYLGELRGAKLELRRSLEIRPDNALAWDLLGAVHEQLGEHADAMTAYFEVQKRSESLAPILAIARCQLYLGQPEAALTTLEALRARKVKTPWTEFFAYQALRRMGRADDAESAARAYLNLAQGHEEHAPYTPTVRRWLDAHRSSLDAPVRQAMVDYVRAACRLRLPQAVPPEDTVLERAPERLFVFDDRPVFVTLYASGERFVGRGRGKGLAAALKGALDAVRASEAFTPLKVRKAALRIDVGRDLEPIELRADGTRLVAKPAFERGRHGIALRADGQEVVALPGDVLSEDLPDLEALLGLACQRAGLGTDAWRSATSAVFRFEAESFLSPAPGVSPRGLAHSEPTPLPEPTASAIAAALRGAGRWLTSQVLPKGGLAAGYSPARDAFDTSAEESVLAADANTTLRASLAFARLARRLENKSFAGARHHLVETLRKQPLSPAQKGLLLTTLRVDPTAFAELRAELEQELGPGASEKTPSIDWAERQLSSAPPLDARARARWTGSLAKCAKLARDRGDPRANRLRGAVVEQLRSLLALQLADRHSYLCKVPSQALGGLREELATLHLRPGMTIEAILALLHCEALLGD